jgi:cytochrome P450
MARPLPPGPRGIGFAFLRRAARGGLLAYLAETAARYGPVSSLRLGTQRIVIVDEPALIEEILVTRQHEFVRDVGATLLRELVGEGLLTTEDPPHLARRRIMQPAFHRARVAQYASTIVADTERVANAWTGRPLDAGAEMAKLTLAAVGATLFGADLRDEARGIADVLARVLARGTSLAALLAFAAPFLGPLHRLFPGRRSILFPRERAELDAIVAPIVKRRHDSAGDDLLSLLLAARDGASALDDEAIRNEVVMLILAGHETTANALTWTWYLLGQHPDVEARVHAEVDAVLGDRRAPAFDDVPHLPYVASVFDEVLRLYPPAGAFARRPLRATELGGYAIPKRASVYVSPFVTQRNARYFPEPLGFDPDRAVPQQKFAYFPFGGGSKMCIGEPFARMEAILAIATIARRFSLRRTDDEPIEPAAQALVRPSRPVMVEAIAR